MRALALKVAVVLVVLLAVAMAGSAGYPWGFLP